jgi:hypothetical protein
MNVESLMADRITADDGTELVRVGDEYRPADPEAELEPVVERSASCARCGHDMTPTCTGHCCADGFVRHDEPGDGGVVVP